MPTYFISQTALQTHFGSAGHDVIANNPHTLKNEIYGKSGWLIQPTYIDEILHQLQGKIINKLPTAKPDTIEIVLGRSGTIIIPQRALTIKPSPLDDFNGRNKEMFKNTIRELFTSLHDYTCVDMRTSRGNSFLLHGLSTFFIHIASSPEGTKTSPIPDTILGIPIHTTDNAYECTWQGLPIIDEETGYVVAELFDNNNLYIHHNIVENGSELENKLFRNILIHTIKLLNMGAKDKDSYKTSAMKYKFSGERLKYIDHCKKRIGVETSSLTGSVTTRKKEIEQLQKDLTKRIREAQALEQKLNSYTSKDADCEKNFGREFDKLISMPRVIKVEINTRSIIVYTKKLYCKHPQTKNIHEIGKFKITIPTSDGGSVKWENLTRKVDGHQSNQMAPHIWQDGTACLGNTQQLFPALIAQYEFSTVAMLAIDFVESVNITDSAGKHLNRWPIVTTIEK